MAKFCTNCGAELNDEQDICVKCGKMVKKSNSNSSNGNKNTMATTGFIIAIVSLFINFAGLVGLAATIVSGIGLAKAKDFDGNGKGLAIAGLVIGIFSIIYGIYSITNLVDVLEDLRIVFF